MVGINIAGNVEVAMSARWGVIVGLVVVGILMPTLGTLPGFSQDKEDKKEEKKEDKKDEKKGDEKKEDDKKGETIAGKTLGEWIKILQSGSDVKSRRKALLVMEVAGAKKEGVLLALVDSLSQDTDAEVRQEVAQLLGRMGAEAKGAVDALAAALKTRRA
jgi:hypothetical protein